MLCVVRLCANRHIARGATPAERNLYATFLVRKKGKQKHAYTYLLMFVQRSTGKINQNLMKIVFFQKLQNKI